MNGTSELVTTTDTELLTIWLIQVVSWEDVKRYKCTVLWKYWASSERRQECNFAKLRQKGRLVFWKCHMSEELDTHTPLHTAPNGQLLCALRTRALTWHAWLSAPLKSCPLLVERLNLCPNSFSLKQALRTWQTERATEGRSGEGKRLVAVHDLLGASVKLLGCKNFCN